MEREDSVEGRQDAVDSEDAKDEPEPENDPESEYSEWADSGVAGRVGA
jgi:hypothetical protein